MLHCVIYSHFSVRNKRLLGTANCPLGFTEVIADFIIILRLRFRCRRQRKFEFDHKVNVNTEEFRV